MNGYGTKPLEYKLWAFTGQGFGGKLQVDFTQNEDDYITLGRFNPAGDTMCIKKGKSNPFGICRDLLQPVLLYPDG